MCEKDKSKIEQIYNYMIVKYSINEKIATYLNIFRKTL